MLALQKEIVTHSLTLFILIHSSPYHSESSQRGHYKVIISQGAEHYPTTTYPRSSTSCLRFLRLCPELRNLIYTYAFSDSGPYYLGELAVVTFYTINQETSDEINIMVPLAVH